MREADIAAELVAQFEKAGAVRIEPGYLQPAELLLDLYGEDIRARAFTTMDPVYGEQMLRPDFTVPVVRTHMEERREPAKYTYAGPVWRKQDYGSERAREYWQVGFEVFDGSDPLSADAEVFDLIARSVGDSARPITGDLGLIFAAIEALDTTDARKVALRRHVWRPARFDRLLDRFSGAVPFDCDLRDLPSLGVEQHIGVRSASEIEARLDALRQERDTPDLSGHEVMFMRAILGLSGTVDACLAGAEAIARDFPTIGPSIARIRDRHAAFIAKGIDCDGLQFKASFGRHLMEYYDGFVFAFGDVASGGRYDALTQVLGDGVPAPAVGGVIRPAFLKGRS